MHRSLVPKTRSEAGFTLIELLVVIAIIAILASILFPVFAQARSKSQQTVCSSNFGQMGKAMIMYRDDHNSIWMPRSSTGYTWISYDSGATGGQLGRARPNATWTRGMIDPYLKSKDVKACPRRPKNAQSILGLNGWYVRPDKYSNREFSPFNRNGRGVNESLLEAPSDTIILWEHFHNGIVCDSFLQDPNWCRQAPASFAEGHFDWIHHGGSVLLWADGHVQWKKMSQLRRPMFSVHKSIYPADCRT